MDIAAPTEEEVDLFKLAPRPEYPEGKEIRHVEVTCIGTVRTLSPSGPPRHYRPQANKKRQLGNVRDHSGDAGAMEAQECQFEDIREEQEADGDCGLFGLEKRPVGGF